MLRTRLIVSLALAALLPPALAQGSSADPAASVQTSSPRFLHEFGEPGQRGSFRVQFDARGAGVVFLQLMDNFVNTAAKERAARGDYDPADYQLLVYAGGDYSFVVNQSPDTPLFQQNLTTARWEHAVDESTGEVRFWIDSAEGLRLTKTFRHRPELRGLLVELQLENRGSESMSGAFLFDLGGPALVHKPELMFLTTTAVAIGSVVGSEEAVVQPPELGLTQELLALQNQELSMAGTTNRFFGGFFWPDADTDPRAVRRITVDALRQNDPEAGDVGPIPRLWLDTKIAIPAPGASSTVGLNIFLGPKSYRVFDEQPEFQRFLPIMDFDLEPPCCGLNVPGGRFMASSLLKLLGWFESILGSWGLAIMLLTILVRGSLAPLNFRMQKSMRAFGSKMAVLKPKLDALKEQYAGDPKAQQQAMIQFQREHKMIPPIGGCLPIFLTMPIYIGLFTALRTAYDLRQEPFMGWISDLSQADRLFPLGIPYIEYFNLLPLLWIALLVTLQLRMPLPTDPQQRQVQQIMRYMPVIFGIMLYNYASGLMVYMVTSMIWTFGESAVIKKILGPVDPAAGSVMPTPVM